jgi:hypothetical protein
MAQEKTKKSKVTPTSKESKYLDSLDFRPLWEDFHLAIKKNGTQKYVTVNQFICAKTKVQWQKDLLWWVLGPKVIGNAASPYAKFEQYDWEEKKTKGFWYAGNNAEQLSSKLSQMHGSMGKLSELGNVNVDFIQRLKAVLTKVDREFGGRLMLPELSSKRNRERVELFFYINRQIMDLLKDAQLMFGKMQGVDLQQLTQFIQMMMLKGSGSNGFSAMLGIDSGTGPNLEGDARRGTFDKLLDMVVEKSATYEMNLPDPEMAQIIVESRKPKLVQK